ncbi:MAG: rhodanese-like domain-containing protein [Trichocoleus desertorum ATA4-8-CV12]|jgi:rhodanese-related sulfurtransferase|nr:rhodanese-like domain-containing protein [Trichocoleus desertorum ATA4-8-CV12]
MDMDMGMGRSLVFKLLRRWIAWQYPQVRWVTTVELAKWRKNPARTQPLLLDARTAAEYEVSHLKTAQRIDPATPDLTALSQINQNKPVVVYCSIGYRSAKVAAQLQQVGFTQVYDLEGSIFQWANEARPLFQAEQPTTKVHPYNAQWGLLLKPEYRAECQGSSSPDSSPTSPN